MMRTTDTVTRYAVIHRDDALWVAIDAREFEISLDDARAAAEYWSEKDAPHRIIRVDATLTDVAEEVEGVSMTKFDDDLWALVAAERLNQIRELADKKERVQRLRAYSADLASRADFGISLRSVDFEEAAAEHLMPGDLGEEESECQ